jgi:hypothetical protein
MEEEWAIPLIAVALMTGIKILDAKNGVSSGILYVKRASIMQLVASVLQTA